MTKTVSIEIGKFTGESGLMTYDKLKREAYDLWERINQGKIDISSRLGTQEAVVEHMVVSALEGFLGAIPSKEFEEKRIGQPISDGQWNMMVCIDWAFTLGELKEMCRIRGYKLSGDKKELAWRLLGYGIGRRSVG